MPNSDIHSEPSPSYEVVARRYRPQGFGELIGQEHVSQALSNAIATHRVGHAYLFTGARGTGKTSTARIFAKALNCVNGPTAEPCNKCDSCNRIKVGDDMDVLEIDGASNRGIDEIRQLRQNVNVRPSRARFKIYIIDEVHMLTREAFNALLKTLEEPPEHAKFIFCTTEATKVPITILSRCQRFDFAGISTNAIIDRLRYIVKEEKVQADDEALEVLARRAAGSMRDSQSLLEQLLSFSSERITVADVHGMLGTAGDQRLTAIVKNLVGRNAAAALGELGAAAQEGVDVALLIEQLFGYFRDCMVAAVGCPAESFLYSSTSNSGEVIDAGRQLGLQTILAAMQILDQTLSRMKYSTQARILAELALVRICNLEDLEELSALIVQLQKQGAGSLEQGARPARLSAPVPSAPASTPPTAKKKYEPAVESPIAKQSETALPSPSGTRAGATMLPSPSGRGAGAEGGTQSGTAGNGRSIAALPHPGPLPKGEGDQSGPPSPLPAPSSSLPESDDDDDSPADTVFVLDAVNAGETWRRAIEKIPGMTGDYAKKFDRLEVSGINRLTICFSPEYSICKTACQRPEQVLQFEKALAEVTGQTIRVDFKLLEAPPPGKIAEGSARPVISPQQRLRDAAAHPFVRRASELLGAHPTSVEEK